MVSRVNKTFWLNHNFRVAKLTGSMLWAEKSVMDLFHVTFLTLKIIKGVQGQIF